MLTKSMPKQIIINVISKAQEQKLHYLFTLNLVVHFVLKLIWVLVFKRLHPEGGSEEVG